MGNSFDNLHQILHGLYADMMPLCGQLIDTAKVLAGLGALFFIAHRVWRSLAAAEPIDVYPLFRPFVIGLCIMFFPVFVLGTLNTILSPVVQGCGSMLQGQVMDMDRYRAEKEKLTIQAMLHNPETAYLVSNEEFDKRLDELGISPSDLMTMSGMYMERTMYRMKKSVGESFRFLLELMFESASLIIDTIRTFFLLVMAILGPIAFAISVYDGFQSTLTYWLARYISVYLWLPVSDLFSSVIARLQVRMLQNDIAGLQGGGMMDGSDTMYILFMLIGIIGYFTVPSVAGWIVSASGMGTYNRNIHSAAANAGGRIGGLAGAAAGNIAGRLIR